MSEEILANTLKIFSNGMKNNFHIIRLRLTLRLRLRSRLPLCWRYVYVMFMLRLRHVYGYACVCVYHCVYACVTFTLRLRLRKFIKIIEPIKVHKTLYIYSTEILAFRLKSILVKIW